MVVMRRIAGKVAASMRTINEEHVFLGCVNIRLFHHSPA
jgi:hypothetical protein